MTRGRTTAIRQKLPRAAGTITKGVQMTASEFTEGTVLTCSHED